MKRIAIVVGLVVAVAAAAEPPARRSGLLAERGLTAADFPQLKKIAENVYVWSDVHPNGIYTTNDLIVVTSDGVLVADGQKDPPTTAKMVDRIAALTSQPIRYVVVASEHGDHTGGHQAFPAAATFIASPISQANLRAQAAADRPGRPKTIVPSETVATRRVLKLGGTDIEVMNNGPAHTGGDLEVYLPKERVFFVSEAFSNHIFPNMRAATPSAWLRTLKNIRQVDAAIVVPGHGFVDDPAVLKEELAAFQEAVAYTIEEVGRLHKTGAPVEVALKQVNWGPYRDWPVIDRNGPVAVQRVYDELDGKLK